MNTHHLRHQLNDLRSTLRSLRTLTPDGPRYKLWLGDLVEFANAAFGPNSPQMARIREVLTGSQRLPPEADQVTRLQDYLARLDAFGAILAEFQRQLREPIMLIDLRVDGKGSQT